MSGLNDGGLDQSKIECGIMMPISGWGSRTEDWWKNLRSFIEDAIIEAGMSPVAVWEEKANDVIHAKIIKNISELPVVIGVVISSNPNVMLECGMRLWTNKPILLVSDQSEKIPFDISCIQCISMPSDCEYFKMKRIRQEIVEKLKYLVGKDYRSFKSYFELPAEVMTPEGVDKINFSQFVDEVRVGFQSLQSVVSQCRTEINQLSDHQKIKTLECTPFSGGFSGPGMSTGPTGSPMLSGDILVSD